MTLTFQGKQLCLKLKRQSKSLSTQIEGKLSKTLLSGQVPLETNLRVSMNH